MATYLHVVTWIPLVVDTRVAVAGSVVAGRHAVDSVNSRMWDFFSNEIILREMQWEKILQCVQHCRWTWQLSGGAGQVFGDRFRISVAVLWGKQPKAVTMNLAGERSLPPIRSRLIFVFSNAAWPARLMRGFCVRILPQGSPGLEILLGFGTCAKFVNFATHFATFCKFEH